MNVDWGKITSDVTQWGEKAKELMNEAGSKAQEKIEEAKLRTQPPITVGPHKIVKIRKVGHLSTFIHPRDCSYLVIEFALLFFVLGEFIQLADGGFSEVFLVRSADAGSEEEFALKRMVCQTPASKADAKAELKLLKVRSAHGRLLFASAPCS